MSNTQHSHSQTEDTVCTGWYSWRLSGATKLLEAKTRPLHGFYSSMADHLLCMCQCALLSSNKMCRLCEDTECFYLQQLWASEFFQSEIKLDKMEKCSKCFSLWSANNRLRTIVSDERHCFPIGCSVIVLSLSLSLSLPLSLGPANAFDQVDGIQLCNLLTWLQTRSLLVPSSFWCRRMHMNGCILIRRSNKLLDVITEVICNKDYAVSAHWANNPSLDFLMSLSLSLLVIDGRRLPLFLQFTSQW